jgi:hypothetical protein
MFAFRCFATRVYRFGPPAWFGLVPASKAQVVGGACDLLCYHAGGSNAKNSFANDPPAGFRELRTDAGSEGETGVAGESIAQNKANLGKKKTRAGRPRHERLTASLRAWVVARNKAKPGMDGMFGGERALHAGWFDREVNVQNEANQWMAAATVTVGQKGGYERKDVLGPAQKQSQFPPMGRRWGWPTLLLRPP